MALEHLPKFGDLLRRARTSTSWSQEQLAEAAGVSVRAISNLERGITRAPHRYTLELIADALDLPNDIRQEWRAACRRSSHITAAKAPASTGEVDHNHAHRLPVPATPLLGREAEIAFVTSRVRCSDVRMVTLTGPGGVGKTRVAIAVAEELSGDLPDGVHFVGLASVRDPDLLLWAIASNLNVHESGSQPLLETLAAFLRSKRLLLVLDNLEHLLEAAPIVAKLLAACPTLNVLATSRAPLRLQGEHEFAVAPLALPSNLNVSVEDLVRSPAVKLFLDRARMAKSDFALTSSNAAAVAAICARLDGLPLAIELAAARIKMLTPQALLVRVDRPLALLTNGTRDAPLRQQTIRHAIAWSYDLLACDEQRILRQCSVFVGGWTLESAEAICDPCLDVFTGLSALVDHSLVKQQEQDDGSVRFRMLETIREFSSEHLLETCEFQRIQERHATYFTQFAEESNRALDQGIEQRRHLDQLESDLDNLRAAFDSTVARNDFDAAFRLTLALESFWRVRGHYHEARRWLETITASPVGVPRDLQAAAFRALGLILRQLGEYDESARSFERAIDLYAGNDHRAGLAQVYCEAGFLEMCRGNYAESLALQKSALSIARTIGDPELVVNSLGAVSLMTRMFGDCQRAEDLAEDALHLAREIRYQFGIVAAMGYLGYFALWRDDLESAERLAHECIATTREVGDTGWLAVSHELLGYVKLEQAAYRKAEELFRQALQDFWQWREMMPVAECLEGLAGTAAGLKDNRRAARLLGAAKSLRERIGNPICATRVDRYQRTVAAARKGISDAEFECFKLEGSRWALEYAIAYALERVGETAS